MLPLSILKKTLERLSIPGTASFEGNALSIQLHSDIKVSDLELLYYSIAPLAEEYCTRLRIHSAQGKKLLESPTLKLGNQHIPLKMPDPIIPQRAKRHRPLLEAIAPQCAVVTLHDIDPETGYRYLDLLSPTPKRGNKPREALIGNSVLTVAPSIGEPRFEAIERALNTRQCQPYSYTYDDPKNGLHWVFDVTVAPLLDADGKPTEVLTIVHDTEPWQRAYWLDQEERPKQQ